MAEWSIKTQQQLNYSPQWGYFYTTNPFEKSNANGIYVVSPEGKEYVYVPKQYAEKGIVVKENSYPITGVQGTLEKQYYNTAFLNPETYKNAFTFKPTEAIKNSDLFKQTGFDKIGDSGFLFPADYFNANLAKSNGSYIVDEKSPAIQGFGNLNEDVFNVNARNPIFQGKTSKDYFYLVDTDTTSSKNSTTINQWFIPDGFTGFPTAINLTRTVKKGGFFSGGLLGDIAGAIGDVVGGFGDIFKELGPIGVIVGNTIIPGLGTALAVAAAIDEGADLEDIAKNIVVGEIVNKLDVGADIKDLTDSTVAADIVDKTLQGLLTGNDLETSLTNAAVDTGISTISADVANQTPDDFQADVEDVLDSPASIPVSDYLADVNNILDLPVTPEPVSGQDLSADLPGNTLEDITNALSGDLISGQDLAADAIPGNTIADTALPPLTEPQLPPAPPAPTEPGLTKAQVETLIKTALAATAADQVINQPETKPPGFDIVPVPTDWKSPVYDQSFTPVDLGSIFQNLQDTQIQWKPRPSITGGAFMGSPVNISDIVNQIMGSELTPQAMPTNITNAVGGILGSTTAR
jgi:hypothetical protein